MNEFTKEDLKELFNILDAYFYLAADFSDYQKSLCIKIQSMIDNYPEQMRCDFHEESYCDCKQLDR